MTDADRPRVREAFAAWLDPGNFAADGGQRASLRALTRPLLVRAG